MFSQATVTDVQVRPTVEGIAITWLSTSPSGTPFQIYQNHRRVWTGTRRRVILPMPASGERAWYDVGTVATGEENKDFSSLLPAIPGGADKAQLTWTGGSFLGTDIAVFRIYAGLGPNLAVNYASPVVTLPAYLQGVRQDGFGMGGFGQGGFGAIPSTYAWTSDPLANGTWHFGITAVDAAGNESTPLELRGFGTGGFGVGPFGGDSGFGVGGFGLDGFGLGPNAQVGGIVILAPPAPPAIGPTGGFGTQPFGAGGFGSPFPGPPSGQRLGYSLATGFGAGGFGEGGFGSGNLTLFWLASPG